MMMMGRREEKDDHKRWVWHVILILMIHLAVIDSWRNGSGSDAFGFVVVVYRRRRRFTHRFPESSPVSLRERSSQ